MNSFPKSLKISVITVAYKAASDCRIVLSEMHKQSLRAQMEIIVVATNRQGISSSQFPDFGNWQWIILPEIRTVGEAMESAIRAAKAPYVAYVEEHSYYKTNWAERLIEAHEHGYDIVGFAVENANPQTLTSWAHLYGQFGPVVAPVQSGERGFLAGHHVSYSRDLLISYEDMLKDVMEDEGALFLNLRKSKKKMFLSGEAISRHVNVSSLKSYIALDYYGQRSFANARAKVGNWPWWKRLAFILATPLIPVVRLRRILSNIYRTGRQEILLPKILFQIIPALIAGAWGEMMGYMLGAGNSAEQKAPAELNRKDYLAKEDTWPLRSGPDNN